MSYINVGAFISGKLVPTKKALMETLKTEPHRVTFYPTSPFNKGDGPYYGDAIPAGITLQVVGPDPFKDRKWYASVSAGPVIR